MKRNINSLLWVALLATSLLSCKTIKEVERAKAEFESGARIEQLYAHSLTEQPSADSLERARQYYQQAFNRIEKLMEDPRSLEKNRVRGMALTVKALSAWRLREQVTARTTAAEAYQTLSEANVNQPRDRTLMAAMDGFIELEVAYDSMRSLRQHLQSGANVNLAKVINHYERIVWQSGSGTAYIESGLHTIEEARNEADIDADVQRYLTVFQLSGLKTWSDELQEVRDVIYQSQLLNKAEMMKWLSEQNRLYLDNRNRTLELFARQMPSGTSNAAYKAWQEILSGI